MKRAYALLCTSLLALTACSGGSDSPAPASPPVSPPISPPISPLPASGTALVIDETNAKAAVRVAYGATADSMSSGDQVGGGGIAGAPDSGFQKPGTKRAVDGAVAKFSQKDPLGPETTDCGIDPSFGTQTISGEISDPFSLLTGTLSPGDRIVRGVFWCARHGAQRHNWRWQPEGESRPGSDWEVKVLWGLR